MRNMSDKKLNRFINRDKLFALLGNKDTSFGDFLAENTYVGIMLKENGYQIYDLYTAEENFRMLMKLDETKEIVAHYKDNLDNTSVDKIEIIDKSNYQSAFYEPIWNNLLDFEKQKQSYKTKLC